MVCVMAHTWCCWSGLKQGEVFQSTMETRSIETSENLKLRWLSSLWSWTLSFCDHVTGHMLWCKSLKGHPPVCKPNYSLGKNPLPYSSVENTPIDNLKISYWGILFIAKLNKIYLGLQLKFGREVYNKALRFPEYHEATKPSTRLQNRA